MPKRPKYRLKVSLVAVKDDRVLAPRADGELVLLDLRLESLKHWHSLLKLTVPFKSDTTTAARIQNPKRS